MRSRFTCAPVGEVFDCAPDTNEFIELEFRQTHKDLDWHGCCIFEEGNHPVAGVEIEHAEDGVRLLDVGEEERLYHVEEHAVLWRAPMFGPNAGLGVLGVVDEDFLGGLWLNLLAGWYVGAGLFCRSAV